MGNPDPPPRSQLPLGQENTWTASGRTPYEAYGTARQQAIDYAGIGPNEPTTDYISKSGPDTGRIVGRQTLDGNKGWRIDYDPNDPSKGFHVNWWDHRGSNRREDWLYGSITVQGGDQDMYWDILSHFPN